MEARTKNRMNDYELMNAPEQTHTDQHYVSQFLLRGFHRTGKQVYVFFPFVLHRNGLGPSTRLFTQVWVGAGSRTAIANAEVGCCYSRFAVGGKARAGDGFHWNSRSGFAHRRTTTRMSN